MNKIIKTIEEPEIKEIDEKKRIIWHKISVEKKDRMGDIVRIDGIDTRNFRKKPAVLYGHMYGGLDPLPVIGENVGFKKDGKKLYAGTKFLDPEKDSISGKLADLANDLWILNKKRLMGWSVGFMEVETADLKEGDKVVGLDFKKSELLEYSNVIIPANQDAINDEIKTGTVKKSLLDGLIEIKLNGEELPGDVAVALVEEAETKPSKDEESLQTQELDPVDIERMFKIVERIKETRESFRESLKKILMEEKSK
ncbi:HK97 family phage prohead protease [bacterium]|nr:HK97 family phage prohead protease [bacterium]